jgi:hypothetical protein
MKKILFLNLRNHGAQEETSGLRETLPQMDLTGLRRGDSVPENLSHDMDLLWARYIAFCLDGDNSFPVTGNEYETLLRRRHGDPRAAAICLDLRLAVLPDGSPTGFAAKPAGAGSILSDLLLAGVRHEVSCLRFTGEIADYGDTVLDYLDEDWTQFTFARRELTAPAPECVRTLRREMLGVPDYSNLVELPQEVSLRQAN